MKTALEIKAMLEAENVGQEYDQWGNQNLIREFFDTLIEQAGFPNNIRTDGYYLSLDPDKQTIYLRYAGQCFGKVTAHKKKGKVYSERSYRDFLVWTYSSFDVELNEDTLEQSLEKAIEEAKLSEEAENAEFNKAVDFINKLAEDGTDLRSIFKMCNYVQHHEYSLQRAVQKTC